MERMIKPPMEVIYADELAALQQEEQGARPQNWKLTPASVRDFIIGREQPLIHNGKEVTITRKFYGNDTLVERAVVTLAGNRGLLLAGEPGTAKTMLSELLSAAICGTSLNTIQGTAGTTEDMVKYTWNYAQLLNSGPTNEALVPAPLYIGMKQGIITRFEEITRCPAEVQDSLISVMSDKVMNIPELTDGVLFAKPGFNLIATANIRDKGVNEMSGALKRRFNFETVRPINNVKLEAKIIQTQSQALLRAGGIEVEVDDQAIELLATTFMELRTGQTREGYRVESPQASLSTAEAVSVYIESAMTSHYYEQTPLAIGRLVQSMHGTIVKENEKDAALFKAYFSKVVKARAQSDPVWKACYEEKRWIQ